MLNSCAPGVTVVNIDNGFGAGVFAARVARNARPRRGPAGPRVIGWVDASSGASGDMLLGALIGAGVPLEVIATAVDAVAPEHVALSRRDRVPQRLRGHPAARRRRRQQHPPHLARRPRAAARRAALGERGARPRASPTFERLAVAEAAVHGNRSRRRALPRGRRARRDRRRRRGLRGRSSTSASSELVVSAVAVGSGRVRGAHGEMPVPPPAVAELLRGVPSYAGPGERELCTPTGAALLTAHATSYGGQPAMTVRSVGVGAGGRDPATHANVLRLFVGEAARRARPPRVDAPAVEPVETPLLLETNIDDLDPRMWPNVIAALLAAGASDAWLTPILMKKGRPAHTLTALVTRERADAVRTEIFRQTSTIGLREIAIGKSALDREMRTVQVDGHEVHVKLAVHNGLVVNAQPEYDDVARAASATGRPVKEVLADAIAASRGFVDER